MAQFHQLAVPKDGSVNGDVLRLDGRATSKMHANYVDEISVPSEN